MAYVECQNCGKSKDGDFICWDCYKELQDEFNRLTEAYSQLEQELEEERKIKNG